VNCATFLLQATYDDALLALPRAIVLPLFFYSLAEHSVEEYI